MTKTLAIIGLVLSCLFFVPLAPLIGLIIGIVSLRKSKVDPSIPKGIATAAIVIGAVFTFIGAIIFFGMGLGFLRGMSKV